MFVDKYLSFCDDLVYHFKVWAKLQVFDRINPHIFVGNELYFLISELLWMNK